MEWNDQNTLKFGEAPTDGQAKRISRKTKWSVIYNSLSFNTFSCGEIEIQINDVGAILVARRRAQFGGELRFHERVRRDPNRVPVHAARSDAIISLYPILYPLHRHLRRPALVFDGAILPCRSLYQATLPAGRYRERASVLRQILTNNIPCQNLHSN